MKTTLLIISLFLILACNKTESQLSSYNFYGTTIVLPSTLVLDTTASKTAECSQNIFLTNPKQNTSLAVKLCNYSYNGGKPDFDRLNHFFESSCGTIEKEILNIKWENKYAMHNTDYDEFGYNYSSEVRKCYAFFFAYQDNYISFICSGTDYNQIDEIISAIKPFRNSSFLKNADIRQEKNQCLYCHFPEF